MRPPECRVFAVAPRGAVDVGTGVSAVGGTEIAVAVSGGVALGGGAVGSVVGVGLGSVMATGAADVNVAAPPLPRHRRCAAVC